MREENGFETANFKRFHHSMEVFNLVHTVSCFLLYGLNRYGKSVHNYVRNYYNWSNSKTFEADSKMRVKS